MNPLAAFVSAAIVRDNYKPRPSWWTLLREAWVTRHNNKEWRQ